MEIQKEISKIKRIKIRRKRNLFLNKKLKNKEKETKDTRYFCGKRSKQKENGKKKNTKNKFPRKKREMVTSWEKQGDTQREK